MWKAKRKSKKRKNDRKMFECEEFRQERERYITDIERRIREFDEFLEKRDKLKRLKEETRILEDGIDEASYKQVENKLKESKVE